MAGIIYDVMGKPFHTRNAVDIALEPVSALAVDFGAGGDLGWYGDVDSMTISQNNLSFSSIAQLTVSFPDLDADGTLKVEDLNISDVEIGSVNLSEFTVDLSPYSSNFESWSVIKVRYMTINSLCPGQSYWYNCPITATYIPI